MKRKGIKSGSNDKDKCEALERKKLLFKNKKKNVNCNF